MHFFGVNLTCEVKCFAVHAVNLRLVLAARKLFLGLWMPGWKHERHHPALGHDPVRHRDPGPQQPKLGSGHFVEVRVQTPGMQ